MERPIGYWIKEVDRLIEESLARLLAEEDLTRRHWQVLNTVAAGPVSRAELDAALMPFRSAAAPGPAPVVESLAGRGWLRHTGGGRVALTDDGRAAHAALSQQVGASRRRVTEGVSEQEYSTTLGVLERMAANLAR